MPAIEMTAPLIIAIVVAIAGVILAIYAVVRAQRRKPSTGVEYMVGKEAVVRSALDPTGTVLAEGELWTATAEGSKIEAGEEVIITGVEGLKLRVKEKSKGKERE